MKAESDTCILIYSQYTRACELYSTSGADLGFGVRGGDEIRQGDLRVLLLLSQMFMERMMQEN